MFAYHKAADVYLSASRSDSFSYGVLEAISQNVPVVVSDIEGTRWSWEYDKCAVFANENVAECVEALKKVADSRMKESNFRDVIEKYNIENWCEQIIEKYGCMLE